MSDKATEFIQPGLSEGIHLSPEHTMAQLDLSLNLDNSAPLVNDCDVIQNGRVFDGSIECDKDTNTFEDICSSEKKYDKQHFYSKARHQHILSWDEIAALLPRSSDASQNVQLLLKCRFPKCARTASKEILGYCPDHFTQVFNEGRIELPFRAQDLNDFKKYQREQNSASGKSPRMMRKREKPLRQSSKHTRLPNAHTGNTGVIPYAKNVTFDVNGRTLIDGVRIENCTRSRTSKAAQSVRPRGHHSHHDNDISESGGSSDEEEHVQTVSGANRKATKSAQTSRKSRRHRCANTPCQGYGEDIYKKLCVTCYNKLADANARKTPCPLPDEVLPARKITESSLHPERTGQTMRCHHNYLEEEETLKKKDFTRKTVHKVKNCGQCHTSGLRKHCLNCGAHLKGGCFCSRCDQSTCTCYDRTETGVSTFHLENQRRGNQAAAGLRKNRYLAHNGRFKRDDISTDGPLDSCEYDDYSMSSYSQESADPTVSMVNAQPSESGENYPSMLTILGDDFQLSIHLPSDRG